MFAVLLFQINQNYALLRSLGNIYRASLFRHYCNAKNPSSVAVIYIPTSYCQTTVDLDLGRKDGSAAYLNHFTNQARIIYMNKSRLHISDG